MDQQRREPDGASGTVKDRAFVVGFEADPTGSGSLDGLSLAVKDLIDVASIALTLDTYSHVLPGMDGGTARALEEALG